MTPCGEDPRFERRWPIQLGSKWGRNDMLLVKRLYQFGFRPD